MTLQDKINFRYCFVKKIANAFDNLKKKKLYFKILFFSKWVYI